jgi:putative ABC transport system substrate-binding protein
MTTRAVVTIALAVSAFFTPVEAQQTGKVPRVGFLSPAGPSSMTLEQFRQGLHDLGYVEGQNIVLEPRFAEGQYDRFPGLAADLVAQRVNVIAVLGAVTAHAANKAVTNIPLVFTIVVDPVKDGIVNNFERPGGNISGVTTFDPQQPRQQLELLKQVIPGLKRVAILGDKGVTEAPMNAMVEQAHAMGLQAQPLNLTGPSPDLDGAFRAMRQEHADAVLMLEEPLIGVHRKRIVELAAANHLPTMSSLTHADAGAVIAYSTSLAEGMRRLAAYVDKVLKGAKPGDLPVESLTRYELIVNLKTAREVGVTIPPEILKSADRVIQ